MQTERGQEFRYTVESVSQVPWRQKNRRELAQHQQFLGPTERAQITLATCTADLASRVYIVAVPQ